MTDKNTFFIKDYKIDITRSVIIKQAGEVQVEPKVLKVLHYLAQKQNQVVSHQELMEAIWVGVEVVPNALQRCIAILRKELGDNAKSPSIIATHPKIGYRLIAEVKWQITESTPDENEHERKNIEVKKTFSPNNYLLTAMCLLAVSLIFSVIHKSNHTFDSLPTQFSQTTALTKTDAHESNAIYSPNGQFVVFNRYAGACTNHIWAKNIVTGKEHQLTQTAGNYGSASFTGNGRELVFASSKACDFKSPEQPHPTKDQCWSIATLDFSNGLAQTAEIKSRYQCLNNQLKTPKALPNHHYVFLEKENNNWQLTQFDSLKKELKTLFSPNNGYLYHFDYHEKSKQFVALVRDKNLDNYFILLNQQGSIIKQQKIEHPTLTSRNIQFFANFEPNGEYLLAVRNKTLYQITLDGEIIEHALPTENIVSIAKHANTQSLLAVQGNKDVDIALVRLGEMPKNAPAFDLNNILVPFDSISRTTAQEHTATFQPNGALVAFISDQNGFDQIWLLNRQNPNNTQTALTHTYRDDRIHHYSWSPKGDKIAVIESDALAIYDLEGTQQVLNNTKPLYAVLDWYDENTLLVLAHGEQPNELHQLNIKSNTLTPYNISHVEKAWAVQNKLFYSNKQGQVFQRSLNHQDAQTIKDLPHLNGIALFTDNNALYSANLTTMSLDQYNHKGEFVRSLMQLTHTAWQITDIQGQQLLLNQFVGISQDLMIIK